MMSFDDANKLCKGRIKAKSLNAEQYFFYKSIITTLLLSKFKIKNCPDEIRSDNILKSLLYGGVSAMSNRVKWTDDTSNHNYVGVPILTGVTQYPDYYEFAQLVNPRGQTEALSIGNDIAVGYNNLVHTPEFDIVRFALFLTEVDTSMHVNVLNARLSPAFRASSQSEAKKFDAVRDKIYTGELSTIVLNDFETGGDYTSEPSHIINFTDVKNVDKIQYLVKLHDDLIRRLCNLHGVSMNTTGKMAQLTTAEVNEYEGLSSIYVNQQYDLLCEYIEESNKINGFNMYVEFGEALQRFKRGELKLDETLEEIEKEGVENNGDLHDAKSEGKTESIKQESDRNTDTNID